MHRMGDQQVSSSSEIQNKVLSWDLVTAYRLNRKLQRKVERSLKSIERLLDENTLLRQQFECFDEIGNISLLSAESSSNYSAQFLVQTNIVNGNPSPRYEPAFLKAPDLIAPNSRFISRNAKGDDVFNTYFQDIDGNKPEDNTESEKKKKLLRIIRKPQIWSKEDISNLRYGIRQQNKQILVSEILFSTELSDEQKHARIEAIKKLKSKRLEMNLEGLDWKQISKLYVKTHKPSSCAIFWATQGHPIINNDRWSKQEIERLKQLANAHNCSDWVTIARELDTNRTAAQCFKLYQRKINYKLTLSAWTPEEDEMLRSLVQVYGEGNWQAIASNFYCRSSQQVLHRWYKSISPDLKHGKWTLDEDEALLVGVKVFGVGKWNKIAEFVPGRTDVKCRERYVNVLSPNVKRGKWTAEENLMLISAVCKVGLGNWTTVAELVGSRSDNQCWRHWLSLNNQGLAPIPHEASKTIEQYKNISVSDPKPADVGFLPVSLENVEAVTPDAVSQVQLDLDLVQINSEQNINKNDIPPTNQITEATDNSHNLSEKNKPKTKRVKKALLNRKSIVAFLGNKLIKKNTNDRDLVGVDEHVSKKRRWKRVLSSSNIDSDELEKIDISEISEYVPKTTVDFFKNLHSTEILTSSKQSETRNPETKNVFDNDKVAFDSIIHSFFTKNGLDTPYNGPSSKNNLCGPETSSTFGPKMPPNVFSLELLNNLVTKYPSLISCFNKGLSDALAGDSSDIANTVFQNSSQPALENISQNDQEGLLNLYNDVENLLLLSLFITTFKL
ncbi:hypothetical protein BB560_004067 [Smittium megazygosporum]|uniref:Myb-like protein L n=1 Tax=Smittium megazygosporum TaxID=133381 RepID=A0A2T9ZAC1_9FUNG|nr:hypothetical protein BB560_004067 [Smittium megazygosporum]